MRLKLEIDNENEIMEISDDISILIENVINKTLEIHNITADVEISLTFTNDEEIRKINKEYRNIDKATDVLSFPQLDFQEEGVIDNSYLPQDGEYPYLMLGDIVISVERVFAQAKELGHSKERETGYLVTHSMLHLLGYDHMEAEEKKRMREKEEVVMSHFGIERK